MPTNLGTPMHVGNPGDRTTPLPITTWQAPRPKTSSIDWAAIQAAQPAPVVEAEPEKTVEQIKTRVTQRRAPRPRRTPTPRQPRRINTCITCGDPIAAQSTRCGPCHHTSRIRPRGTCIDCGTSVTAKAARCRTCQGAYASAHKASNNKARPVDPKLAARVHELYTNQGMSIREVAEHLNSTPKVITGVMRKAGVTPRAGQSGGGNTLRGIHDRLTFLGVTSATIRQWARNNGHAVGVRGVVPTTLIDAYEQATR